MNALAEYSLWSQARTTFIFVVIIGVAISGCLAPDPRTVRGALDAAARAIEAGDGRALFAVIDRRSRDAMISIVHARTAAARLVTADYPPEERQKALVALGEAGSARDAEDLFARRCAAACMTELEAQLGAPIAQVARGPELEVRTARGGRVRLYRGDASWGIVWNTAALSAERARAARELIQIRHNAEVYRRRRALEASWP